MNQHGIIEPAYEVEERPSAARRARAWLWRRRNFIVVVILPTVLVSLYLFLVASNQYESEAHFLVRRAGEQATPAIGVSEALSMATGISSSQSEEMSVSDYLTSHDAVQTLRDQDQLVQRYRRPSIDPVSRLWVADPTPETLLRYYRRQISVKYDTETGITTLRVRGFTPDDALVLARKLLELGEARVNLLNKRSYEDAIATSRTQLAEAEQASAQLQERLTHYRQSRSDIDPRASGQAQITLVSTLTAQLAAAKAQLAAMGGLISKSSPQYRAVATRVAALQAQIANQSARLTGSPNAIAQDIGGYESLTVQQEFLAKRYDAAAAALEKARADAARQQLYVVRVVEPNLPVKSTYPQRFRVLATVLISLFLAYAIGWLIAAGVKEHAA